jgi:sugar-specific transcriptional regulator TrmB
MPTEIGQQESNQALILAKLGLGDIEQKMYLDGIKTPPLPVSLLAKRIGLTRSNAYNVISSLQAKGLCWNLGGEYGRKIMFAGPEKLLSLHRDMLASLKGMEKDISQLSKSLSHSKYSGPIAQPRVQYFEGTEGVKKLYSDSLSSPDGLIRTAVYQGIFERFGKEYVENYIQERHRRGMRNKILYPYSLKTFNSKYPIDPTNRREVRIPPKSINFDSMIIVYGSKVAIITMTHEIFGTLIESVDYSNTMKSWFDTIWGISRE